ncbi:sensor histidine kinase [Actinomadura physcomitrii]|nr:nitrate- and nitrite sensing domain-containing protein [Actinomadura physcomitrii]
MAKRDQGQGSHHRPQAQPVRRRIALLLAMPLIALLSLWGFAAVTTASAALQRYHYSTMYKRIGLPVSVVTAAVQGERTAAASVAGHPTGAAVQGFQEQTRKTDAALAAFRKSAFSSDAQGALDGVTKQRLRSIDKAFSGLAALRSRVGSATPLQIITGYDQVTETAIPLLGMMVNVDDISVYQQSRALIDAYWAEEFILREDALMASVATTGRLSGSEYTAFVTWSGNRAQSFALSRAGSSGHANEILGTLERSPEYNAVLKLENDVVRRRSASNASAWPRTTATLADLWLRISQKAAAVVDREQVHPVAQRITTRLLIVCGLGLLVVVVSVVLSIVLARGLAAELRRLQQVARHMAHERLPQVVGRLRRGEPVDVEEEVPAPPAARTSEIVDLADAFVAVQRTAITTAVGEAELRSSISQVFVNLSWRSQSLLHRQLRLLDAMEGKASSPEELEDLFRLDHLTTRMRRHAEGLVILSGSPTVRAWDHPVLAEDVVRSAISEVEDYTRVEVVGSPPAAISGDVVADIIHLLAELIENATTFSPPATEVTVKVESVAAGLAVEVVDRGVGIHPLQRAALNERLAQSLDFDLADTDRLGLFVVARLAAQHAIKVSLHQSPYGGTSAIVLIPAGLLASGDDERALTGQGPGTGGGHRPRALAATAKTNGSAAPKTNGNAAPQRLGRPIRPASQASAPDPVPPAPAPAPFPDAPPAAAGADDQDPLSSEITGVLPQRVRQRHLAPQLRQPSRGAHAKGGAEPDDFDEPDPDLSRGLMSSLQEGWLRGREDDEINDRNDGQEDE